MVKIWHAGRRRGRRGLVVDRVASDGSIPM